MKMDGPPVWRLGVELITPNFKRKGMLQNAPQAHGRTWEQIKFRECVLPLGSESSVFCPIYKNVCSKKSEILFFLQCPIRKKVGT
jgi:hypothetical protein